MATQCCIRWCRSQTDGPGKSGGFFKIPSLDKKYSERLKVVNAAGLGEAYMTPEAGKRNYRICWRHYKESDIDRTGQRLTLNGGRYKYILKYVPNPVQLHSFMMPACQSIEKHTFSSLITLTATSP